MKKENELRYWGIGAMYDNVSVVNDFLDRGIACVGWDNKTAGTLHSILKDHIKVGDVIFIKSYSLSTGLRIKAVGIVNDNQYIDRGFGFGVGVTWKWDGIEEIGKVKDKYNVRSITLFEEFNPEIIKQIDDLLIKNNQSNQN